MDSTDLADRLMRKLWHRRTQLAYNLNVQCNYAFIGREIEMLLRVHAPRPADQPPWETGRLPPLMGIDLVPSDSLRHDEWQLRDQSGTVRAFGTLTDIREETS